jgi:hypothetical protein
MGVKITPSDGSPWGGFGTAVAISTDGTTALVGSETDGLGAAFVFTRSGDTWTQQAPKLVPIGGVPGAGGFGGSVALSADGDTALVGAWGAGKAWVFTRSGTTWAQEGTALSPGDDPDAGAFGRSVALSADGNTALIGGDASDASRGGAWVFGRSGGTWAQQGGELQPDDAIGTNLFFGTSVALSADGTTALVGGPEDNGFDGAVWQFTRQGGGWAQDGAKFTPTDALEGALFGSALSLSADGETLVVTGIGDHGGGAAWVYTRSGSGWSEQQKLSVPGTRRFGSAVAVSADGSYALITDDVAPQGSAIPSAWGFARTGSTWSEDGQPISAFPYADGENAFGSGVALTGDGAHALVGDPGIAYDQARHTGAGAIFAFAKPALPGPHVGGGGGGGSSAIAVALSPVIQTVASGGAATWTVSVTNTGGAYLSAVTIADPSAPSCNPPSEDADTLSFMAPQLTVSYSCTDANVTNSFTNTVSVLAITGPGDVLRVNADAQVIVEVPTPLPTVPSAATTVAPPPQTVKQTIAIRIRVLHATKLGAAHPALTCRLNASASTRLILVLRDARGRRLTSWTENARKGSNSFLLHLPRSVRRAGHDVLALAATARTSMAPKPITLVV